MGDARDQDPPAPSTAGPGRRQFMVRAAVVGTAAWAVPTIITMEPAGAAALTSPPPRPPEVEVESQRVVKTAAGSPAAKPEVRGALATTGAPIEDLLGLGAAAIAGGGALHVWSTRAGYRIADAAEAARPFDIPEAPD